MNLGRRIWLRAAAALLATGAWTGPAHAADGLTVEGYPVEPTMTVAGVKLTLNGAGVRKRGYFKTEMGAVYLTEKLHSHEEIFRANGPKRIRLVLLQNITPQMAARYFLSDFKMSSTEEEYKSLLTEVGILGNVYGSLNKLAKGDIVDVDWIPGTGFMPYLNGQPLLPQPIRNERFFKVVLRNYVGYGAPQDYRDALLGLTPPNVAGAR